MFFNLNINCSHLDSFLSDACQCPFLEPADFAQHCSVHLRDHALIHGNHGKWVPCLDAGITMQFALRGADYVTHQPSHPFQCRPPLPWKQLKKHDLLILHITTSLSFFLKNHQFKFQKNNNNIKKIEITKTFFITAEPCL